MRNLADYGDKEELRRVFSKFGPLTNVWVADDPPGFAYIFFRAFDDAEKAVEHTDGRKICGVKVRVELSPIDDKRRMNRGGGGGGGGRGGYQPRGSSSSFHSRDNRSDFRPSRGRSEGGRSQYGSGSSDHHSYRGGRSGYQDNYGSYQSDHGYQRGRSAGGGGRDYYTSPTRGGGGGGGGYGRGGFQQSGGYRDKKFDSGYSSYDQQNRSGRFSRGFGGQGDGGYRGGRSDYGGGGGGHFQDEGHSSRGRGGSRGGYERRSFPSQTSYTGRKEGRGRDYQQGRRHSYSPEDPSSTRKRSRSSHGDIDYREHRSREEYSSHTGGGRGQYEKPEYGYPKKEDHRYDKEYAASTHHRHHRQKDTLPDDQWERDRSPHRSSQRTKEGVEYESDSRSDYSGDASPRYEFSPKREYRVRSPPDSPHSHERLRDRETGSFEFVDQYQVADTYESSTYPVTERKVEYEGQRRGASFDSDDDKGSDCEHRKIEYSGEKGDGFGLGKKESSTRYKRKKERHRHYSDDSLSAMSSPVERSPRQKRSVPLMPHSTHSLNGLVSVSRWLPMYCYQAMSSAVTHSTRNVTQCNNGGIVKPRVCVERVCMMPI